MNSLLIAAILLIQAPNGTVTGRVLTSSGVPAVGVRVTAKSVADSAAPATPDVLVSIVQTDSEGRFRLENVAPGRYYITAGLVASPTYYPGTVVMGDAKAIDITTGSTANVPDFTIQPASIRPPTPAPVIAQDPRLRLMPRLADAMSLDLVQDAQASFEAIGKIAGARLLFDRRFVPGVPVPFRAQGNVFDALNLLSFQTGNTWMPVGRDTIIVVPASFGITNLDLQLPSRDVVEAAAVYPGFSPRSTGPLSIDINSQSTDAFETIANMAGMSVVLDPDFRFGKPIQLKIGNADIYSALDILCAQYGAFWMPYDSKTVFVSLDNITKHRDYDVQIVKMYHLSNLKTPQEISDAVVLIRRALSLRVILAVPAAKAIAIVDAPRTIALADKLIQDLDKTPVLSAEAEAMDAAGNLFVVEPAGLRNVTPYRSELQPRAGLFTLDSSLTARQAYEKVAESAGIRVVFDPNLGTLTPGQLQKIDNVDFFKALDLLSIQTRTFWIPLDTKTIFVTSTLSTSHRDYDPQIVKTFYLNVETSQEVFDIRNIVLQALNVTGMTVNAHAKALIIRDNPRNMTLAEMLIAQLNKDKSKAVQASAEVETWSISNTFIRDFTGRHTVNPVRSLLQPAVVNPISMQLNGNGRDTYEALAKAAGLQVTFDSRFVPGIPFAFHVENANIFDALNILSYQTRTFWRVADSQTIQVAPATYAIRNELEPKIQKSVSLRNVQSPQEISDIVNTVRQILLIQSGIAPNAAMNTIEINETAEKVAVAEALINALDIH
jgi:hypothetical protein